MAELASKLASAPESEIPGLVAGVSWTWPKSDFFFWTPVLNRFDSILETVVAKHDLKHLQTVPFSPATKELLLAVLDFTRTLWDNCTNRNVYASYEVRKFTVARSSLA